MAKTIPPSLMTAFKCGLDLNSQTMAGISKPTHPKMNAEVGITRPLSWRVFAAGAAGTLETFGVWFPFCSTFPSKATPGPSFPRAGVATGRMSWKYKRIGSTYRQVWLITNVLKGSIYPNSKVSYIDSKRLFTQKPVGLASFFGPTLGRPFCWSSSGVASCRGSGWNCYKSNTVTRCHT